MGSKSNEANLEPMEAQTSKYGSLDETVATKISQLKQATQLISTTQSLPPKPAIRQRTVAALKQQLNANLNSSPNANANANTNTNKNSNTLPASSNGNKSNQQMLKEAFKRELESKLEKELNLAHKSIFIMNNNNNKQELSYKETNRTTFPPEEETQKSKNVDRNNFQQQQQQQIVIPKNRDHSNSKSKKSNSNSRPETTRPYPKKVLFIIANEFCERFSYYGLRTVLVLYLKNVLGFTETDSAVSFHLFATLCYLTPILGAILGDSVWGKYNTIVYLSIVYFLGELLLVISSIFWDQGLLTILYTFVGLFMIGVGTGGIKPCVGALGGDQFLPNEESWRQSFFSLFYATINAGSLISMFVTPMLRSQFKCVNREDCYPYAFGLPCALMFLAIVIFVYAKNQYHLVPLPEKNVIVLFCQCVWLSLKRKLSIKFNNSDRNQRKQSQIQDNASDESTLPISNGGKSMEVDLNNKFQHPTPISMNEKTMSSHKRMNNSTQSSSEALIETTNGNGLNSTSPTTAKYDHWLYLSADRFDLKTIDEFKTVLDLLVLALPLPVYWCLFDQQSSLWTLQATRMDGRVFNTSFILQPDQMSVANPLLLLISIPIFEIYIYPNLNRCNLLTKPLQRMTFGGLLAALTFVLSSLIELRIQEYLPPTAPLNGQANLIIVNGLSECFVVNPMISNIPIPTYKEIVINNSNKSTSQHYTNILKQLESFQENDAKKSNQVVASTVAPLSIVNSIVNVISSGTSAQEKVALNGYKLKFELSSSSSNSQQTNKQTNQPDHSTLTNDSLLSSMISGNCPFNPNEKHELNVDPLQDKSVRFLYLMQGNGKLSYKLFNESLELPPIGKARVRLIYESFGSSLQAEKRTFYLKRAGSSKSIILNDNNNLNKNQTQQIDPDQFKTLARDGQVFISEYLDTDVSSKGELFQLKSSDPNLKISLSQVINNNNINNGAIFIEQGTRGLIVAHQKNATHVEINYQILQDNNYRISMLYQLIPYLLISMSEVLYSITGLQFSYAMAPDSMKSLVLGIWSLSTAFGNLLTVVIESMHLFSNIAYDFLFYAIIMAIDMVLFAILAHYYKPYNPQESHDSNGTLNPSSSGNADHDQR